MYSGTMVSSQETRYDSLPSSPHDDDDSEDQHHKHKFFAFTESSAVTSLRLKSAILAIGGLIFLVFPMLNFQAGVSLDQPAQTKNEGSWSGQTLTVDADVHEESIVNINVTTAKTRPFQETATPNNLEPVRKGKVMFHMGVHKTGTTSIQHALSLQVFKDSFMEDNFIVGNVDGGGYGTKSALAKCLKNKQSCSSSNSNGHISTFGKRIEEALVGNHNLVLSSEQFDYFRPAKMIKRFFHEFEDVQVILFYRRFFEWGLSMFMQRKRNHWQSWDKGGSLVHKNFVTFLASENISSYAMKESRYTISTYLYYKKHFNVSLVNMHAGNGDSLTNFLCNPTLNAPNTCRKRQRNELQVEKSNQVKGTEVYDEIAMAAYAEGLIDAQQYSRDMARSLIQKHQESSLNRTSTNFSFICPSAHQLHELLEVSIKTEREYFPEFFESEQGEAELRKKFHKMVSRSQFCSVDTEEVLADPLWKNYFVQW
mmetsp:Transcript_18570/g.30399  ORF Transcript_18570/g.30399 Transcript_18570/m.30399 type:complete len:481 (+) Transcript_18570:119-1561(+)